MRIYLLEPGNLMGVEVRACHGLEYLLLKVIFHYDFGAFPDPFREQGQNFFDWGDAVKSTMLSGRQIIQDPTVVPKLYKTDYAISMPCISPPWSGNRSGKEMDGCHS